MNTLTATSGSKLLEALPPAASGGTGAGGGYSTLPAEGQDFWSLK